MRLIKGILIICLLIFVREAWGQECNVSAVAINFGNYFSSSPSNVDANGEVTVACTHGKDFIIMLDPGLHSGYSFNPRKMHVSGGVDTLRYNLYRDSARTEIWGDGTGNTYTKSGKRGKDRITIYGRIPGGQNVPVGSFNDLVTVIIEW